MKAINLLIFVIMIGAGLVLYPRLPQEMPVHWDIAGRPNSYMAKNVAVLLLPAINLAVLALTYILPRFDPKREKYRLFSKEWEIIRTGIVGFMAYIYLVTLYLALNPGINIIRPMLIGLGVLFVLIGNYMGKIRQNYFIGIRVPWTLANEDNWNKTHRIGGRCFFAAGAVMLIEAWRLWQPAIIVFASIVLAAAVPIAYSFFRFRKGKADAP